MWKRICAAVGLCVFISSLGVRAVVLPPPSKTAMLIWDYPIMSTGIVFNVYQTTSLALPPSKWLLLTNDSSTSCVVQVGSDVQFFAVTASNTVTHLESPFK